MESLYYWFFPARNAPDNLSEIIKNEKNFQLVAATREEIIEAKNNLRHVETRSSEDFLVDKKPLMRDFDNVFSHGYKQFFEEKKSKKEEKPEEKPREKITNKISKDFLANLQQIQIDKVDPYSFTPLM